MKLEYINENETYWTCESSIESQNCFDYEPHRPYKVKAKNNGVWYLHRFNEETGEIDEDTNATAICTSPNHCFATREEALVYYKEKVLRYANELQEKARELLKTIEEPIPPLL